MTDSVLDNQTTYHLRWKKSLYLDEFWPNHFIRQIKQGIRQLAAWSYRISIYIYHMMRFKTLGILLAVVFGLIVLGYLVLKRHINPDRYFVKRTPSLSFDHIEVQNFIGGINLKPILEETTFNVGTIYDLDDQSFGFEVDSNGYFILTEIPTGATFVLGKVENSIFDDNINAELYTIAIPRSYITKHEGMRGRIPFYESSQFTMMSSGGLKYSWAYKTTIQNPKDESLLLYAASKYMHDGTTTGIVSME
ncbi:MAG: hypothetical protein JJ967_08085 [Muricauda sp.]|nr:hypothetical protein [Allomuricauda sp.]